LAASTRRYRSCRASECGNGASMATQLTTE
jgi:hypothetical protein